MLEYKNNKIYKEVTLLYILDNRDFALNIREILIITIRNN